MSNINNIPIESEIRKIGLTEKEAKVYMACLELGKTSVQNIAKKINLSRPTTYRLIKSLEDKELIKKSKQRGNHFVIPESPDEILGMLRAKKRRIEEQEREFVRIISILKTKYFNLNKNEIKSYVGPEGINFLLEDFSTTHKQNLYVIFNSKNNLPHAKLDKIYIKIRKRLGNISIKEMYPKKARPSQFDFVESKCILNLESYFPGMLIIYDKVIYFQKDEFFAIEQENIIHLIKSIVKCLWENN